VSTRVHTALLSLKRNVGTIATHSHKSDQGPQTASIFARQHHRSSASSSPGTRARRQRPRPDRSPKFVRAALGRRPRASASPGVDADPHALRTSERLLRESSPSRYTTLDTARVTGASRERRQRRRELTLWSGTSSTQCSYKGGSSHAHPSTEQDRAAGRQYVFVSCTGGGWRAGLRFSATRITLHVERGDDQDVDHMTGVRLHLLDDDRECKPRDAGADARPDAGSDASTCTAAGSCLIGSACVAAGAANPANACQSCQPTISASSWSNAANGAACDDGNACTQSDSCQSGACVGANPLICAADACHSAGTCDPARGCVNVVASQDGTPCTGADKCNQVYQCTAGTCTGSSPVTCTASDQWAV